MNVVGPKEQHRQEKDCVNPHPAQTQVSSASGNPKPVSEQVESSSIQAMSDHFYANQEAVAPLLFLMFKFLRQVFIEIMPEKS
ncbi:hypothetical protein RND71_039599 [Anisodus tanguticus]|uniref:Uncharacterized protein n=1 Tax=Anisodus tanguticus TaxID=243964 RepID=A0AAE1QWY4_9SOLA|nr:hypothetical protein RND71_039599 [Anisodus tanguticus]